MRWGDPKKEHLIVDPHSLIAEERFFRKYLFEHSSVVRITMFTWIKGLLFRQYGGFGDPKFRALLKELEAEFIDCEHASIRHNQFQLGNRRFYHFYFHLSDRLKEFMSGKDGILWFDMLGVEKLYGFEDPTFFREGKDGYDMVGAVVSHEPYLYLYVPKPELAKIKKQVDVVWEY